MQNSVSDVIVQDDDDLVADYDHHPSHQMNNNNGTSLNGDIDDIEMVTTTGTTTQKLPFFRRALPPLPKSNGHPENGIESHGEAVLSNGGAPMGCESPGSTAQQQQTRPQQQASALENEEEQPVNEDTSMDFAASIEKVKDVSLFFINLDFIC